MKNPLDLLETLKKRLLNGRSYYWLSKTEKRAYMKLLNAQLYLIRN